jgi:hypothetical protein
LLIRMLDAETRIEKRDDHLKQHAIFAHEMQYALTLTVGFVNMYFDCNKSVVISVYQICQTVNYN